MSATWDILTKDTGAAVTDAVPQFQPSNACDTVLCMTATHILQTEALERTSQVVIKALRQQIDGTVHPDWIPYLEKHLARPDFDDFPFDPFDDNRLFNEVLRRMQKTLILYVSPRTKCDTRMEAFVRPLQDLLNMMTCENVQKALAGEAIDVDLAQVVSVSTSDAGKRVKIVFNLARAPIPPAVFLNMDYCEHTCDDIRRLLFLNPGVHRQLLAQLYHPMPPFLSRSSPLSGKAKPGRKQQQPSKRPEGLGNLWDLT